MAKETFLLFIITILMVLPGPGFSDTMIQTNQHIIVIDPGHGGSDTGLIVSGGMQEKNIVLKLSQKTAQYLESQYNVILTRTKDTNISAVERMVVANTRKADLFLSIHVHGSEEPSCFFYYFDPPEPVKGELSIRENTWKSQPIFRQKESKQVVSSFLDIFSTQEKTYHAFSKGAPVIFLEGATMPAVFIEPLSISLLPHNPDEINTIIDEYASLIAKSIDLYFKTLGILN